MRQAVPLDVLILGDHASAHLTAAALRHDHPRLSVARLALESEHSPDRLTMVNPRLFDLHRVLGSLRKAKAFAPTFGLSFLSDEPGVAGEFRSKQISSLVVSTRWFQQAVSRLAAESGVDQRHVKQLVIRGAGEDGVHLLADGQSILARVLICAMPLSDADRRTLNFPEAPEDPVSRNYQFARVPAPQTRGFSTRMTIPMCLDLGGTGAWAWALTCGKILELGVLQPPGRATPAPSDVIAAWCQNLKSHGILSEDAPLPTRSQYTTITLPTAQALIGETVASRTLLIGSAGGFISDCAEEIYPTCWSGVLAAATAARALRERHVQDALAGYRAAWGSTLGDYLRGPQQNLRLLLPLVYRNPMMAARVAEAILFGESVVR
ncbi:MAG: hypothetical protein NZ561_09045 [Phycisphaerae bacterium]|nr:hypothetical protein [Phycisphaerae bacterium]